MPRKRAYNGNSLHRLYLIMKYILLIICSLVIIAPLYKPVFAAGSGGYCLRLDEKEFCRFPSMEECNDAASLQGGYCAENFRLYTSGGNKRYCLATRFGTRCNYNSRKRCVNAAGQKAAEGAACIDNYKLSGDERRRLETSGASDCGETDFACQSGFELD